MKIIDRYVLITFIKNYLISFMVLIGMYIALDMVFNFANLTQTSKQQATNLSFVRIIYDIGDFYFYQAFVFFVHLSGIIAVVAAAFTLMRLSRFNELTALLAAGTPLLRISMSIVIAGAILNLVLLPIDQEVVIPQMIPKLIREHGDIHEMTVRTRTVSMMQDNDGNLFNAARYSQGIPGKPAHVLYLDVIQRNHDFQPVAHLYASQAEWDEPNKQWKLTNGYIVPIDSGTQSHPATETPVSVYKSDITPEEIALDLGKDYVQLLPTAKLNEMIAENKSYGTLNLARTKHLRFTQPVINVILLLLAIPAVLSREQGKLKSAAAKCMTLTGLCMGSVFIFYQIGGTPPDPSWAAMWPSLMAWVPIFIFGPLSVFLLGRVKS